MAMYELSDQEHATVLAALRDWQNALETMQANGEKPEGIWFEDQEPLTATEVAELCERINVVEKKDCKVLEFNNYIMMMPAINTKLAEGYELVGPVQVVTSQDGLPRYVATMIR